ncbi:aspartate 1-decarboxylase [bacterium]|nr:aspartate 1-decarboxylase [bacterium]
MLLEILKSKIHRATVTEANINYIGSITIDESIMESVGLHEFEKVHVFNINNGTRAETYVIKGNRGKRDIILNGALARLAQVGDRIIIVSFGLVNETDIKLHQTKMVVLDEYNNIVQQ